MNKLNFTIFAQNSVDDYVQQACLAAMSLRLTNPDSPIALITNDAVPIKYKQLFDHIVPIPFDDQSANSEWKVENRWKIYHATPFKETAVIDSDMLVLSDLLKRSCLMFMQDFIILKNVNLHITITNG